MRRLYCLRLASVKVLACCALHFRAFTKAAERSGGPPGRSFCNSWHALHFSTDFLDLSATAGRWKVSIASRSIWSGKFFALAQSADSLPVSAIWFPSGRQRVLDRARFTAKHGTLGKTQLTPLRELRIHNPTDVSQTDREFERN
jgi:hypothetical protein